MRKDQRAGQRFIIDFDNAAYSNYSALRKWSESLSEEIFCVLMPVDDQYQVRWVNLNASGRLLHYLLLKFILNRRGTNTSESE